MIATAPPPDFIDFNPFAGPALGHLGPVTEPQAEIWTAALLGGNDASRAYNESVAVRLTGPLNRPALRRAFEALSGQHEALRTAFSADGRYLCVFEQLALELPYQDLTACPAAEQAAQLAEQVQQHARHVFDLVEGPLLLASLLQTAPTCHHLLLTAHHIVCDGWSLGVLLQDLGKLYSAAAQQQPLVLPPAPAFSHYAAAQDAFYHGAEYARAAQYWLTQFAGRVPVLDLPTDFPRPARRTYASQRLDFAVAPKTALALKETGRRAGCSFVTTLLAAFEVLLYQLTGQPDVVVGLPAAGQSVAGMPRLVGHCVSLLPLRSFPTDDTRFVDFLQQRKTALFDAYEHQGLTFGTLLKKLAIGRTPGRVPLVPVVFNVDMGLDDGVAFHELAHQVRSLPRAFENFELFLNASGTEKALVLEWSYNAALFAPATVAGWMARFEALLAAIVAHPTAPLSLLAAPAAPAPAPNPAYRALNATARHYPAHTLPELVATQARATPQHPAVQHGQRVVSYHDLHAQANQLAAYLRARGVQPGQVVAVALGRSPALVVALLAVLKCGAAYLPLDPAYPADRLAYMLADAGAVLLLAAAPVVPGASIPALLWADVEPALADYSPHDLATAVAPAALAYVLYTSGSTGQPKGVQVTHGNLTNLLLSMRETPGLEPTDRLLAVTTVAFDIAGLELFLPLIAGATVVLADAAVARDGQQLLQLLQTEGITTMQATPATWRMLLDAGWTKKLPLRALCGGEALPAELATRLVARCASLWNVYGPTETTIWSAVKQVLATDEVITIGHPIANTQFYFLDDHLRPVAPGEVGELVIGGAGVAQGYRNRPALTREKFLDNPFANEPGARLYRTGDLARLLPSGEVQCLGRADHQIKLRGYRIEPGEIEHALTQLAGIRAAVVLAHEERPGHAYLRAYVVPTHALLSAEIPAHTAAWQHTLRAQLPAHLVPAQFTVLPALPLTPNGKIDRQALLAPPATTPPTAGTPAAYAAPRTDTEQLVASIWAQQLGREQVGIFDDFFELGGHSLVAVQVMTQLAQATGKQLPLAALFEHATVEKLALLLQADSKVITWDALVPIKPHGTKTPLYIVHGAGLNVLIFNALARNMSDDQPVYGLQGKGLNGIDEPLATVEEMAAYYVAAIRAHNPAGPYALAGYSFGGVIAYEMARQLLAAGLRVHLLGLFDTYAPRAYGVRNPWHKKWLHFHYTIHQLWYEAGQFKNAPRHTAVRRLETIKNWLTNRYLRLRHGKQKQYELLFKQPFKVTATIRGAERRYCLAPLAIRVELFRTQDPTYYMHDFDYLGWKDFAQGGLTINHLPGTHDTMFAPPHDVASARLLQRVLDSYAQPPAS